MAYSFKGDITVGRGLTFGSMSTANRILYASAAAGTVVYDTTDSKLYIWDGTAWQLIDSPKNNVATVDPTASNDSAQGYLAGSLWLNTAANRYFICENNTAGSAVWERIDQPKINAAATVAPTATDDSGAGYEVGSLWVDTTLNRVYFCVDATTTAAVWKLAGDGQNIAAWAGTTDYVAGQVVVAPDGSLVQAGSTATSTTTFNAAEVTALGWTRLGQVDVKAWAASRYYFAGSKATRSGVTMVHGTAGVSAATFTSAEAANWTFESQNSIGSWAATTVLLANTKVSHNGVIYQFNTTGTTGATFTASNWTALTDGVFEATIADATTAWGTATAGVYSFTVTAATHGIANPRLVQVYESVGSDHVLVSADVTIASTGGVTVSALATPDTRFAGRIEIR